MNLASEPPSLATRVAAHAVPPGRVAAWWLGGSGFILKTPTGAQIYVDPYLSDVVAGIFDQPRAFPSPLRPAEARPDAVIATHWHEDHLDPEAIPLIARHSPATTFVMPPSAMARALSWGVPRSRIKALSEGGSLAVGDLTIRHVPARHLAGIAGWEVPDAMGVTLETAGLAIYHSGDTEYDLRLRALAPRRFDVAMLPINGSGGNMDPHEAALLAWQLDAGTVIPMHHLLWATPDAADAAARLARTFAETYRRLGGAGRVVLPAIGEPIELGMHRAP